MSSDMLSEQGELVIDEGTINISTVYSQGWVLIKLQYYFLFKGVLGFKNARSSASILSGHPYLWLLSEL